MINAYTLKRRISSNPVSGRGSLTHSRSLLGGKPGATEKSMNSKAKQQRERRNQLAQMAKQRAEAWASATFGNQIAHTLKEGTINLNHPTHYQFRTTSKKQPQIGPKRYSPERKRSEVKQAELQALLMSQGRYKGPLPWSRGSRDRIKTNEIQHRMGYTEHETKVRVKESINKQPSYEFEAIKDKSLLRELPVWRSTVKEKWKTKLGFKSMLSGKEGWSETVKFTEQTGAEPYFDGLQTIGECKIARDRNKSKELGRKLFYVNTSKNDWMNEIQRERSQSPTGTYRSFLSQRILRSTRPFNDTLFSRSTYNTISVQRTSNQMKLLDRPASPSTVAVSPNSHSPRAYTSEQKTNNIKLKNYASTTSNLSMNSSQKLYKKTLEEMDFKSRLMGDIKPEVQQGEASTRRSKTRTTQTEFIKTEDYHAPKAGGIQNLRYQSQFNKSRVQTSMALERTNKKTFLKKLMARNSEQIKMDIPLTQQEFTLRESKRVSSNTQSPDSIQNKLNLKIKLERSASPPRQFIPVESNRFFKRRAGSPVGMSRMAGMTLREHMRNRGSPQTHRSIDLPRNPSQKSVWNTAIRSFTPAQNTLKFSRSQKRYDLGGTAPIQ